MNKTAFIEGYLMKVAAAESLVATPAEQFVPDNEADAAMLSQVNKDVKYKLRTELKELDLQMSQLRALKKKKELLLSTT
jgi:hypothetical protein